MADVVAASGVWEKLPILIGAVLVLAIAIGTLWYLSKSKTDRGG